jgi:hypothetical protein
MPVTMKQVRAHLDPDEPDYAAAAQLGPGAIPHLKQLVQGADPMLASKAAYLASLIQSGQSADVLELAARSSHDEVRVAAAAGLRNLSQVPGPLLDNLLKDLDPGVRKVTLHSLAAKPVAGVKTKVEDIAKNDPDELLRDLAKDIFNRLP